MGSAISVQVYCLGPQEQLLVNTPTDKVCIDGPGVKFVGLGKCGKRRKGIVLNPKEYVKIKHELTGEIRVVRGPTLCFLGPRDTLIKKCDAIALGPGDYVTTKHAITGELQNILGPRSYFLGPYEQLVIQRKAITLKHNEYVRLVDDISGEIRVEVGEQAVYIGATERIMDGGKKKAVAVDAETAVLVKNTQSGTQRLVTEQQLFFPSAYDEIMSVRKLIKLAEYETVIVQDRSGQYHFISGVMAGTPMPDNTGAPVGTVLGDVGKGATKTKWGRSRGGGGGNGGEDDDDFHIEIRAASGKGSSGGVAFFLPPYCSLVELMWSSGIHKKKRNMKKSVFDSRPWFCNYEFVCRTSDNVELTLELTFFWSLENVPAMIRNTDDAPGDICHHARSEIVQSVSKVDLRTFMQSFNDIVRKTVIDSGDMFYNDRGVRIHSIEVRSFQCRDDAIDKVLQNIIKETTDRINRLQKIESENEVRLEEMKGRIETEKLKGGLVDVQNEHMRKEALMEGEAEAARVRAFIEGLCKVNPSGNGDTAGTGSALSKDDSIKLFNLLRKVQIFSHLGDSGAHLYLTPDDANLRIATNVIQEGKEHSFQM